MRSHPKAAAVGSDKHLGQSALGRVSRLALAPLLVLLVLACAAATADATQFQRPFKETFGRVAQPSFGGAVTLAVDTGTNDVLVGDAGTQTIQRFHADGAPAPFTALGTNSINGKAGAKPCAEEPASCDKTPQNGIEVSGQGQFQTQIAIDDSGGPTDGDIYLTQVGKNLNLVDIFAPSGTYLGQLTAGSTNFKSPCGVAVDSSGAVYVSDRTSGGTISKFVPTGNPPVNADDTANFSLPENICAIAIGAGTTANWIFGVNGGANGERIYKINKETGAVQYTFAENEGFSFEPTVVDPTTGHVIVAGRNQGRAREAVEFDASGNSGAVQVARLVDERAINSIRGLAVGSSGDVYVALGSAAEPHIEVYGPPVVVPTVTADPASNVTGSKAILTGIVNPEGLEVSECFFKYGETTSYGNTAPCEGSIPTDSSPHPVHLNISGLEPNGHTYHYRLFAKNANGTEESQDQTLITAHTVATEAATGIGTATATLHGTVRPEGSQYTNCVFEYGLLANAGFEKTAPCSPAAPAIEADFAPHAVSAAVGGLQKDTTYRFRLTATNSEGTLSGEELTFTTQGPPQIFELRTSFADQGSATLEAKINPSGFGTSYRFEWGPTTTYGNSVPADFEPFVGSGEEPVSVNAKISGLSAGTTYHYRVVATNSVETTESPDQTLETLDSCGQPDERCFELVSPHDAGPVAAPGQVPGEKELHFQAAPEPGSLAYIVESGFPDATKGAEVLYHGTRGPSGWNSTQLSLPLTVPVETSGTSNSPGQTLGLSEDLSCGIVESNQPLTDDPSTRLVREAGGGNLYRHNPDGSYTAITKLAPENPAESRSYNLAGFSGDCGKVVFTSHFRYPGVPAIPLASTEGALYEWDEGTLRSVGFVPGPSGETAVAANPGGAGNVSDSANLVSDDGSRVFFGAERKTSGNPEEVGKAGVFVREDGTTTRDLSLSETSTPDSGATYAYATPDGSRVFFTANAGLTAESSSEGIDLYEYDLEKSPSEHPLTDLSVDHDTGGAQVGESGEFRGFIGASEDGSHVYFAARGRLVPGRGKTFAQNQSDDTYSVYGEEGGTVSFVGAITAQDLRKATPSHQSEWSSRVSPDGRYLLFESSAKLTGYDSGGAPEAYLYDADAPSSEAVVCVSCRQDGRASLMPHAGVQLLAIGGATNPLDLPHSLVMRDGEPQVFFRSVDRLAAGATEGQGNIYEWSHGQVFSIVADPPDLSTPGRSEIHVEFAGASADGTDVYFATPQTLSWEDGDKRPSIYDARIGGGFPEPPPSSSEPCEPRSEGSCQGASSPGTPPTPTPASSTFNGSGNAKPKATHKKRHKRHHRKRKARHAKHKRQANGIRRAGK